MSAPAATGPATVSVVVCAYTLQRLDDLVAACTALGRQTRVPDEVVLVVDHCPPLVEAAARRLPGVRVVQNAGPRGLSGARNHGTAVTTGDVVLFLDDDAVPEATWVEALCRPFEDGDVVGVGGWAEAAWDSPGCPSWFPRPFLWVVGCSYEGLPADGADLRNPIGAAMGFRREALLAVGGFPDGVGRVGTHPVGCEETELSIRVRRRSPGARIVHQRSAVVRHRVRAERRSLRYFARRCYWEGRSKAIVAGSVGSTDALSSERSYALRTLPAAALAGPAGFARSGDPALLLQSAALLVGLVCTVTGFTTGKVVARG
ncbi:glycosyltransferase family 2 protein [Kineococcus gypseus]|uniref:glycosyltransferase family 2 protein n=1 Tax=Kineococcus gypseus TaxID=1637102 RepID=UPI003D7D29AE